VITNTSANSAPIANAHAAHAHRAGPRTWCSNPNANDDSTTPITGTSNPRKKSSSPTPLASAIHAIVTPSTSRTAGRSAACSARAHFVRRARMRDDSTVAAPRSTPSTTLHATLSAPSSPTHDVVAIGSWPSATAMPAAIAPAAA
jgi:hypothetical protein